MGPSPEAQHSLEHDLKHVQHAMTLLALNPYARQAFSENRALGRDCPLRVARYAGLLHVALHNLHKYHPDKFPTPVITLDQLKPYSRFEALNTPTNLPFYQSMLNSALVEGRRNPTYNTLCQEVRMRRMWGPQLLVRANASMELVASRIDGPADQTSDEAKAQLRLIHDKQKEIKRAYTHWELSARESSQQFLALSREVTTILEADQNRRSAPRVS